MLFIFAMIVVRLHVCMMVKALVDRKDHVTMSAWEVQVTCKARGWFSAEGCIWFWKKGKVSLGLSSLKAEIGLQKHKWIWGRNTKSRKKVVDGDFLCRLLFVHGVAAVTVALGGTRTHPAPCANREKSLPGLPSPCSWRAPHPQRLLGEPRPAESGSACLPGPSEAGVGPHGPDASPGLASFVCISSSC